MLVLFVTVLLRWVFCVAESSEVIHPVSVQTLKLGEPATVECLINSPMEMRVWYKVTTGRKLQLVATFNSKYNHATISQGFHPHFSVKSDNISSHLILSSASWDDVGTYFCGTVYVKEINFGSGTFLTLEGEKRINEAVTQQPESQSVQSGQSVALSCSVASSQCLTENTEVMWLKVSQHSTPEMIYSSGNQKKSHQSTESGETTSVYELFISSFDSDGDAGTYYCVVTSCGQVLFGKGTTITNSEIGWLQQNQTLVLLTASNIVLGFITLLLVRILYKSMKKRSAEVPVISSEDQLTETVTYSVVALPHRSLGPSPSAVKHREDSVLYSDVRTKKFNLVTEDELEK